MKITFLGTSHGIVEKDRFTSSALLTVGDKNYLIDAGAPIMKLLQERDVEFNTIGGIFITHSHSDHFIGLVEFTDQIEAFRRFEGLRICVHCPELFPYNEMRRFLFGEESTIANKPGGNQRANENEGYRVSFENYSAGEIFDDGNIKITAYKTRHYADSHAFLVEAEGKKILFSGDLRHDVEDFPYAAAEGGLDLLIMEAAHAKLGTEPIINKLARVNTPRMIINHVYYGMNPPEAIKILGDSLKDKCKVTEAFDGMVIEL